MADGSYSGPQRSTPPRRQVHLPQSLVMQSYPSRHGLPSDRSGQTARGSLAPQLAGPMPYHATDHQSHTHATGREQDLRPLDESWRAVAFDNDSRHWGDAGNNKWHPIARLPLRVGLGALNEWFSIDPP